MSAEPPVVHLGQETTMRVIMILLALVVTPLVAGVSQGRGKPARPASRTAAPSAAPAAQSCSQQQGQHEGSEACSTPPPPPPPPPPPATCSPSSAPAGDVLITGTVLQATPSVGLADWCVQLLLNGVVVGVAKSNAAGTYTFSGIAAGSYMVCEVVQAGWFQTFPTVAFTGAACASGYAGYLMVLPAGSSTWFNDFINSR
jgi:hypothetical protein